MSEYVYNPDGSFAGIVRQQRRLRRAGNDAIRVIQQCEPGPELKHHPMGRFAGEWVFDLKVEGRARHYLGPDVLGAGVEWGEGVMTGRGLWPRFGHNFTSFAALPSAERQITGGRFFNAGVMVANIIGLAVASSEAAPAWPCFSGPHWPGEVSRTWRGARRTLAADGSALSETAVERRYDGMSFAEPDFEVRLEARPHTWQVTGAVTGFAQQTGWLFEIAGAAGTGPALELMEVLDNEGGHLIGFRRWLQAEVLTRLEVIHLRPIA